MRVSLRSITMGNRGAIRFVPVAGDDEVHLVNIEELGVNPGDSGRVRLVVVVDELHRPVEKAAPLVDVVPPDLHGSRAGFPLAERPPVNAMPRPILMGFALSAVADRHSRARMQCRALPRRPQWAPASPGSHQRSSLFPVVRRGGIVR